MVVNKFIIDCVIKTVFRLYGLLKRPYDLAYFQDDLRKNPKCFSRQNFGGGLVMIWAAFQAFGKTTLASSDQDLTRRDIRRSSRNIICLNPSFSSSQSHSHAPVHVSLSTKLWVLSHNISILDWPSRSPDLSPVENLWDFIMRIIFI